MINQIFSKKVILSTLSLLGLFYLFIFILSKWGLGVNPDSVSYLAGAENISFGNGYTFLGKWILSWPPGYSTLLALLKQLLPFSLLTIAGILHALLFMFLALVMERILDLLNTKFWYLRWIIVVAFMFSVPMAVTSTMVSTELLCILIQMFAFYLFMKWQQLNSVRYLYYIGGLMATSILVRFAAIAFFGIFALMVFWESKPPKRTFNFIIYTISSLTAPFFYHLIISISNVGTSHLEFIFHPIEWSQIKWSYFYFRGWFNGFSGFNIFFFLFAVVLIFIYIFKRKHRGENTSRFIISMLVFNIVAYYFFLIFSVSFFDKHIPLSNRLLAPIAPFFFILLYKITVYYYIQFRS